jgi:hypothetical protein
MKRNLLLLLTFTLIFASFVSGANTHLNISMYEVVYRNATFAENFSLTEQTNFCNINGTLNITNPGFETVSDIYLQFSNTDFMGSNFTHDVTTKFGNQTVGQAGTTIIIHIPSLRQNNYSTFYYTVDCTNAQPPLNVTTSYTNTEHGNNRKVLAGYNWTVNQTVTNQNYLGLPVSNINISITAQAVNWNASVFNFSLEHLYGVGDYSNTGGNGTDTKNWWWSPNGGSVPYLGSENISYRVRAPLSVPFTATYSAISEIITYDVNYLISNISLDFINATGAINTSFEKRISQPADNEFSHNVTWEIRPKITVAENISYDINSVTLWVTENLDPTNKTDDTSWGLIEINYTGSPMQEINLSSGSFWGNSGYYWQFNYTDGINSTYPPPIVWMKPEWLITNKYGQIVNYTNTINGLDVYTKYIYVIHGYWLEVSKNVTNIDEDQYQINIYVENIGNGWTPEYERVTVYDFVPNDFAVWDMQTAAFACPTGSYCTNLSVGTVGSDYYGMSYRWDIPWKDGMNSSLGPKVGPYATSWDNYSWNVSYKVNGTGPYRVTDLYIVGLDPLKVDGASVSPVIAVITGLQSYTKEIIYVGIVAFLIIINISNLVITNKINNKLDHTKLKHKGK